MVEVPAVAFHVEGIREEAYQVEVSHAPSYQVDPCLAVAFRGLIMGEEHPGASVREVLQEVRWWAVVGQVVGYRPVELHLSISGIGSRQKVYNRKYVHTKESDTQEVWRIIKQKRHISHPYM